MRRSVILYPALLSMTVCGGGNPTSPSTTGGGLPFEAGRYSIELLGGSDQCGDIKIPQAGTGVSFVLTLRADATGWTGTTSSGALVMHFQPSTSSMGTPPVAIPLAGTASGFADDEAVTAPPGVGIGPNGTRATFTSSVPFSGGIPSGLLPGFASGTINGPVVFSRNGVTATCPSGAVGWTMNRVS